MAVPRPSWNFPVAGQHTSSSAHTALQREHGIQAVTAPAVQDALPCPDGSTGLCLPSSRAQPEIAAGRKNTACSAPSLAPCKHRSGARQRLPACPAEDEPLEEVTPLSLLLSLSTALTLSSPHPALPWKLWFSRAEGRSSDLRGVEIPQTPHTVVTENPGHVGFQAPQPTGRCSWQQLEEDVSTSRGQSETAVWIEGNQ